MSSGQGSLLPPNSIRLALDLVAVTGEHKKIIGQPVQICYYTLKLQGGLILIGPGQQPNHMSLSSAANGPGHMGPGSRDMSTREEKIFESWQFLLQSINGRFQTLGVLLGDGW
jgi:hypothetical protein